MNDNTLNVGRVDVTIVIHRPARLTAAQAVALLAIRALGRVLAYANNAQQALGRRYGFKIVQCMKVTR